jgi:uncharacterized phage infection (PIP) family protein YhgE
MTVLILNSLIFLAGEPAIKMSFPSIVLLTVEFALIATLFPILMSPKITTPGPM